MRTTRYKIAYDIQKRKGAEREEGGFVTRIYDFDEPVERRGTSCAKYDMATRRGKDPELLPLWVADMDFRVPDEVTRALHERVDHAVFGYTDPDDAYYEAVSNWFRTRHGWSLEQTWFTITPGVVFALASAVRAFTEPGDAVLIQPPVYYPFRHVIRNNARRVVTAPLTYDRTRAQAEFAEATAIAEHDANVSDSASAGSDAFEPAPTATIAQGAQKSAPSAPAPAAAHPYSIDLEAFERVIAQERPKLFLLCNPHNPVGRVWSEPELRRLGEICLEYGVIVASDEIHADFARPGFTHVPFASLGPDFARNCVVCTAPSKTFNLAGMQVSNIITPNEQLRKRFKAAVDATGFDNINTLGMVAARASYEHGGPWLDQLKAYLDENLAFMNRFVARKIPGITVVQPQGTYLTWLDCSGLGISHDELVELAEKKAKLWLDHGAMFGAEGTGFLRFNNATQRATLTRALEQLAQAACELRA